MGSTLQWVAESLGDGVSYIGDFRLGDTFDTKFTTVSTTGAPTTLAGTPVISAYVGNSLTQITAGITLTVDFDGVTGLHNVRVVATSGNGYATASNYQLVITTGTVGGTSVAGYVVAEFSIEARSAVMPTVAARTLDVSSTGESGVDWANVGSPTSAVALTNSSIAVNSMNTGVITALTFAAGAIDAPAIATNAFDADALSTDAITEITAGIWNALVANYVAGGSLGRALGKLGNAIDIRVNNNNLNALLGVPDTAGATVLTQILTTALTEAYAADGAAATLSQLLYAILSAVSEFSISGTTITAKKLDGTTTSMTFTLDDGTNPTSRTRAS